MPKLLASNARYEVYAYGPEHQRVKLSDELSSSAGTIYLNPDDTGGLSYEKETKFNGTVEHRHYITANGQVVAMLKLTNGTTQVRYFHRDNLGSTVAVSNGSGTVLERLAYEPFGKRRFPDGTADPNDTLRAAQTDRGYTNHEHLDELALIHMNGRVYDPLIGRFMSADPVIQNPYDLQSYNRYSYVGNNPLRYTDPSGYCILGCFWQPKHWPAPVRVAVSFAIAFYAPQISQFMWGVSNPVIAGATGGFLDGAIQGGTLKSALTRGITAAAFGYVGDISIPGSMKNIVGHTLVGCVSSEMSGGDCQSGALASGFGAFATGNMPVALKGNFGVELAYVSVVGGTASVLGGGKFANGAMTAAYGYLFNYCAHATTKCFGAWAKNLGKIALGGLGMFGGGALCTTGVGCALGSVGVIAGGANVYEGADWVFNRDESTDGVNPIKRAITNAVPSANADLAFASMEVLGGGLALKAPIILKDELWFTIYGIQRVPGLPITVPASSLPQGAFDAAGAAWDGANAAIDQAKKKRP